MRAMSKSWLRKFAKWLRKERDYGRETIRTLLYRNWDGAYPASLLGDDLIIDIENFLYDLAEFALDTVFGEDSRLWLSIVPRGNYDDLSGVYILEMRTRSVLAYLEEKTWNFGPDLIEECLRQLIEQLEKSRDMLAVRLVVE
jgi:hypothetical protein